MNFSQDINNFTSVGIKTNFDFKIAKKFRLGFYVGTGITKRVQSHFFLESWTITGGKLTYVLSQRINFVFQAGHNTSKYKKYPFDTTIYDKVNLGVALKL